MPVMLPYVAFAAASAALLAADRAIEKRTRVRPRRKGPIIKGVPLPGAVPLPHPMPPEPPGGRAPPYHDPVPHCPPGKVLIPYEGGWFCIDPPPQAPVHGGVCEFEGAWSDGREFQCVQGFWVDPAAGRPCSSPGGWAGQLLCGPNNQWAVPVRDGPCHPNASFTPDHTLHCVDQTWRTSAVGQHCRVPQQYHPTLALYCGPSQMWEEIKENASCPSSGARSDNLVCYDGEWRSAYKCAAAAAACGAVPIPGLPKFACWSAAPGKGRCDW